MSHLQILVLHTPNQPSTPVLPLWQVEGHRYALVESVEALLQQLRQPPTPVDLILLVQMGATTFDAIAALRQLRQEATRQAPPIVILDDQSGDRARVREALQLNSFHYISAADEAAARLAFHNTLSLLQRQPSYAPTMAALDVIRSVIQQIAAGIHQQPDNLAEAQRIILATMLTLTGADNCALSLFDPISNDYKRHVANALPALSWKQHFKGRSLTKVVVGYTNLEYFPDVRINDEVNDEVAAAGVRSLLVSSVRDFGALYAYSKTPSYFNGDHIKHIEMLAALAMNILQHHQQASIERTLREVANELATRPAQVVPLEILKRMAQIVPYTTATIQVCEGDQLHIVEAVGFAEEQRQQVIGRRSALSAATPNAAVIAGKASIYLADATTDQRYPAFQTVAAEGFRSWLGAPLLVNDEAIGIITIEHQEPNFYRPIHSTLATSFATIAASALNNARLSEQMSQGLRLLVEVNQSLTNLRPDEEVLKAIARGLRYTLHCDSVVIYRYDPWEERFLTTPLISGNLDADQVPHHSNPGATETMQHVLKVGELFHDLATDSGWRSNFAQAQALVAWAGVRIQLQRRLLGVLFVNYNREHLFTTTEKNLIRTFVNQAAVAIQLTELQHRRDERQIRQLRELHDASRALIDVIDEENGLSITDLYTSLLRHALKLTASAFLACLQLFDTAGRPLAIRHLYPRAFAASVDPVATVITATEGPAIFCHAIQSNQALLVEDVQQIPAFRPLHPQTRSMVLAPLTNAQSQRLGILLVCHDRVGGLDESDKNVLELLVRQAVVALEKAAHIDELGVRAQLIWADIAHGILGHFTRGRVQTIRNNVTILAKLLPATTSPTHQSYIDKILQLCQEVIDESGRLASLRDSAERLTVTEVHELVSDRLEKNSEGVGIETAIAQPASNSAGAQVEIGRDFLRHALDIIVNNAIKALSKNPPQQPKRLTAAVTVHEEWLQITLTDTGPGIPPDIRPQLFKQVIRHASAGEGSGIGLLVARTIIEGYSGQIDPPQSSSTGATIKLRLPLC